MQNHSLTLTVLIIIVTALVHTINIYTYLLLYYMYEINNFSFALRRKKYRAVIFRWIEFVTIYTSMPVTELRTKCCALLVSFVRHGTRVKSNCNRRHRLTPSEPHWLVYYCFYIEITGIYVYEYTNQPTMFYTHFHRVRGSNYFIVVSSFYSRHFEMAS